VHSAFQLLLSETLFPLKLQALPSFKRCVNSYFFTHTYYLPIANHHLPMRTDSSQSRTTTSRCELTYPNREPLLPDRELAHPNHEPLLPDRELATSRSRSLCLDLRSDHVSSLCRTHNQINSTMTLTMQQQNMRSNGIINGLRERVTALLKRNVLITSHQICESLF